MRTIIYKTKNGLTPNYIKAKEQGIEEVILKPIEEEYKTNAVKNLVKARRKARKV